MFELEPGKDHEQTQLNNMPDLPPLAETPEGDYEKQSFLLHQLLWDNNIPEQVLRRYRIERRRPSLRGIDEVDKQMFRAFFFGEQMAMDESIRDESLAGDHSSIGLRLKIHERIAKMLGLDEKNVNVTNTDNRSPYERVMEGIVVQVTENTARDDGNYLPVPGVVIEHDSDE